MKDERESLRDAGGGGGGGRGREREREKRDLLFLALGSTMRPREVTSLFFSSLWRTYRSPYLPEERETQKNDNQSDNNGG